MPFLESLYIKARNISLFSLTRAIFGFFGLFYFQTSLYVHLTKPNPLFRIPLFDIALLQSPMFLGLIEIVFCISIILFIFGKKVELTGLLAGITKFIFLISHLEGVLAFSYLIPLGFMAFSFTALMAKDNEKKQNLELPISLVIASIFIIGALEKLVHFDGMKIRLAFDLVNYYRPSFFYYCPYGSCLTMDLAPWIVIPVELVIGILFLFYRFRRIAFLLNSIFIVVLFTFVSFRTVGVLLITLQLAIGFIRSEWKISDITKNSLRPCLYLIPLFIAHLFMKNSPIPFVAFIDEAIINLLMFLPLIVLSDFAINPKNSSVNKNESLKYLLWPIVYATILLLFALLPLIDGHRKTHQMGWSMFSGATANKAVFKFQLKKNGCQSPPNYAPVIHKFSANQTEVYSSFSEELITRYKNKIIEVCPDANVSDLNVFQMSN